MSSHQYFRSFDPESEDSLAKIYARIENGSVVLDIGAGPGVLAEKIVEHKNCIVDGVEGDARSIEHARSRFRQIELADLENPKSLTAFGHPAYDVIVVSDVLEHLREPEQLLSHLAAYLGPEGKLLLSVPNIGHAGVLAELINGDFRYRQEGLLDQTHLRFFTRRSLLRMLRACGWVGDIANVVRKPFAETEFASTDFSALAPATRSALAGKPDADVYQFIVEARPAATASRPAPQHTATSGASTLIDVVIPVFEGAAATRRCLESVLESRHDNGHVFNIIVIDDATPNAEIRAHLDELAAGGEITLFGNTVNAGFVASVNRGLRAHPERDVVILNSDTEVASDWLDRLRRAVYSGSNIATATPFSNNATICSYPRFCADNGLPAGYDVMMLDGLFQQLNPGETSPLLTCVGFCTYLRREAVEAIGDFDSANFGRGYGEEVDFAMRGRQQGWQHVLAGDVFVYHQGEVSFADTADDARTENARILRSLHPYYDFLVAEHIQTDPARPLRHRVDTGRLALSSKPKLLLLSHAHGGGVERHITDLKHTFNTDVEWLVLRPAGRFHLQLTWENAGEALALTFDVSEGHDRLRDLLTHVGVARAHVHQIQGYETTALSLLRELDIAYDFTVHDFYTVCPQINFYDSAGQYCGQPEAAICDRCLAAEPVPGAADIASWRASMTPLLNQADRVFAPSRDAAARIRPYAPDSPIRLADHSELTTGQTPRAPQPRPWRGTDAFRIAVLGQLDHKKGLKQLDAAARDAQARGLPLAFHLIGEPTESDALTALPEAPVTVHGRYDEADLPAYLRAVAPHLVWFPAQWPETHSYTLSAALAQELPVVASDIGAFIERLTGRTWSWLVDRRSSAEAVNDLFVSLANDHFVDLTPPDPCAGGPAQPAVPAFSYQASYLPPNLSGKIADPWALVRGLDRDALSGRRYDVRERTDDWLRERLIDLQQRVDSLRGGITDRDAEIRKRIADAERLRHRYDTDIAQLKHHHQAELHKFREQHAHEKRALEEHYEAELNGLREQHAQEKRALEEHYEAELNGLREQHAHEQRALKTRLDTVERERDALLTSRSLRITRPFRAVARRTRAPTFVLRNAGFKSLRWGWHRLPLSGRQRKIVRNTVYRHTPWLLPHGRRPASPAGAPADAIGLPAPRDATLPEPGDPPRVSVIIPVYNAIAYTRACLDALADQDGGVSFEVIVVDDASADETEAHLSGRHDLVYLLNATNKGFIGTCNRGAAVAKGAFLLFLNNDALLAPDALSVFARTFADAADAGLVGAKLLYADGRLQEAGGIVWRDGTAWNWGRLDDPARPRYNFLRDVDYCSGAAIAVRGDLFAALDGFDTRYMPAYYEDNDLAFRLRELGYRTLYQPLAWARHFEGVSHGQDETTGIKAYQTINREKFLARWNAVLNDHEDNGIAPEIACDRKIVGHVLIVDAVTPTPDRDSGSIDMYNYMRILLDAGYRVTFIPDDNLAYFGDYTDDLRRLGVNCLHHPYITDTRTYIHEHGHTFACTILARAEQADRYAPVFRAHCPAVPLVFLTVDLHYLRLERQAEIEESPSVARRACDMKRVEHAAMATCDATIVLSETERQLLRCEGVTARLAAIPLVREPAGRDAPFTERRDLLFVGGFDHHPNVDAVMWFLDAIWPRIAAALPGARFHVVGSGLPSRVADRGDERVQIHGHVADLASLLETCRLTVAPLRYGAGQKGKIVTSLSHGVPCVTTAVGAEGMGLVDGETIALADDPAAFADTCVALYHDPARWEALSEAGQRYVTEEFSVATNAQRLIGLFVDMSVHPFDQPCAVCGETAGYAAPGTANWLDAPRCAACESPARVRALARAVIDHHAGAGAPYALTALRGDFRGLAIGTAFAAGDTSQWIHMPDLSGEAPIDTGFDAVVVDDEDGDLTAETLADLLSRVATGGLLAVALPGFGGLPPENRIAWLAAAHDAGMDAAFHGGPGARSGVLKQAIFCAADNRAPDKPRV